MKSNKFSFGLDLQVFISEIDFIPPALVVLSHTPEAATETVAWVGKGIVYDTGGLSIKVIK